MFERCVRTIQEEHDQVRDIGKIEKLIGQAAQIQSEIDKIVNSSSARPLSDVFSAFLDSRVHFIKTDRSKYAGEAFNEFNQWPDSLHIMDGIRLRLSLPKNYPNANIGELAQIKTVHAIMLVNEIDIIGSIANSYLRTIEIIKNEAAKVVNPIKARFADSAVERSMHADLFDPSKIATSVTVIPGTKPIDSDSMKLITLKNRFDDITETMLKPALAKFFAKRAARLSLFYEIDSALKLIKKRKEFVTFAENSLCTMSQQIFRDKFLDIIKCIVNDAFSLYFNSFVK